MTIIATAGWNIPRDYAAKFAEEGSALQRYAALFYGVEINSCFYRAHRPETYERWAASVPDDFRFAVKLRKSITHERRLVDAEPLVADFMDEVSALGTKLGPVLVQLPPSLGFEADVAGRFFAALRRQFNGAVVCEPRHADWFSFEAKALLKEWDIARVAADPAKIPDAAVPGGAVGRIAYWRLHGAPRLYYSAYDETAVDQLARQIKDSRAAEKWCVFNNTASGAALGNALALQRYLAG